MHLNSATILNLLPNRKMDFAREMNGIEPVVMLIEFKLIEMCELASNKRPVNLAVLCVLFLTKENGYIIILN